MQRLLEYRQFIELGKNKKHKLSGVVLIVDDRILLVNSMKFKDSSNKWSIPKGHVELQYDDFKNAIKELEEETGIILNDIENLVQIAVDKVKYEKKGIKKTLRYYVFRCSAKDLNVGINDKWEVHKHHYNSDEIYQVRFMDKFEAMKKMDKNQKEILKYL